MFVKVFEFLFLLHICYGVDFIYYVKENKTPNTYLGNIGVDTHMIDSVPSSEQYLVRYSQLQQETNNNSQLFNVTSDGKLYTAKTLDAESLCKYNTECFETVDIAVRKGKSFVRILEIKVVIEDINDNQPEFEDKEISLQFYETDGKGTTRSIPNAIDKDVSVKNSQIIYELIKNMDDPFSLVVSKRVDGSSNLMITLENKLDREVKDKYLLQVIAKNGGSRGRNGNLSVQIFVTDVNDNRPVFSQKVYNITINNGHRKNVLVLTLSAKDFDSGRNGKITYHFSSKTSNIAKSYFQLNQLTGEIFLNEKFKPEEKKTYKLFIEARDGGSPPMSSITTVFVNVINQENNPPKVDVKFSESTGKTASISEGMEVGSFIAYVKVVDNDIGLNGQVTCDLRHDKLQLQSLSKKKYKVIVKNPVDRETQNHMDFIISCEDKGTPRLRTQKRFTIKVMDVNDVRPQFTKDTFKFLTYENEKPNFPIGLINVTDSDLGPGGQLTYILLNDSKYNLPFKISDFGFITTTQSLDHEQQSLYSFHVLVKDNGVPSLSNTAKINVEVMDENDNAPYFTFPNVNPFSLDVHYHPQSENDITVLRASDRDSRQNAFLKYEIHQGNNRQLFMINSYTGVLSFSRPVYQNDAGTYNLKFIVKDSGTPVLSATTTLSLTLTVSNKTSTMYTAVNVKSDDKIHINLFIIIIVAAVTVSVVLVVSITICIIRRNNQRNSTYTDAVDFNMKISGKNEDSEFLSEQLSSQYDVPVTKTQTCKSTNSLSLIPTGGPHYRYESNRERKSSTARIPQQATTEATHQTSPQQATRKSLGRNDKETSVNPPYRYSEMTSISYTESGTGWNKADEGHCKLLPGHTYCQPEKFKNTGRKSLPQTNNRSQDINTLTRPSYQANINQNTPCKDVIDLKSTPVHSSYPNIPTEPWNMPSQNSFTTYTKPLPAIPKISNT
ncbi:protocadherin beta-15-like isoform X1 [Octopus sinensis]|uniref:Protocadherin beta-15-like isoform X1 n=1 Tax=Octopus sinensis TaxID=2607531 RepID=A0A6P7T3J8_9MOLL|nr:protocadherin beta-15-like isoform X1 [Octopus sinensis]